ncbi:MAG: ABC transporter permease [Planctomycetota bacterium]
MNAGSHFLGWLSAMVLIVRHSLLRHKLSTTVTVISAALASGLVMAVFSLSLQTTAAFGGGDVGFDAVLGARGSQVQLVLNTVYHLDTSPGNIPWSMYQRVKDDPRVELAVPYAVGDNYRGYRIVGTTTEIFTDFEYRAGKGFEIEPPGLVFDPERREAVIGSTVARELSFQLGDTFHPTHGVQDNSLSEDHEEKYRIIGVLRPTNSPSDRVIWIPIEGVFRMGGHTLRGVEGVEYEARAGEEIPDEHKQVSAVMLELKGGQAGFFLSNEINKLGKDATLAWPIAQVMVNLTN